MEQEGHTEGTRTMQTLPIEQFEIGHRYVNCHPGYEHNWTVVDTSTAPAKVQHQTPAGEWITDIIVTVEYGSGRKLRFPIGTDIAIECDKS